MGPLKDVAYLPETRANTSLGCHTSQNDNSNMNLPLLFAPLHQTPTMELIQEVRATLGTKVNSLSTNAARFTFYIYLSCINCFA